MTGIITEGWIDCVKSQIDAIIKVANDLQRNGTSASNRSTIIAAAFVLNNMDYLPESHDDVLDAWKHLNLIQQNSVEIIKVHCMDQIIET